MAMTKIDEDVLSKLGPKKQFIMGNEACVLGSILAGCRFYAGYPITPSTEIMEGMGRLLPRIGGMFIQMEDEIASLAAVIGASLGGLRSMTATSGPGFSLMQENIGYACMTETPCVIVDVMRGGPSTGQPTEPSQGDVMQARWGTHGDHEIIAVCPNSCQETLDMSIEAFNLADKYRVPVIILLDAEIAHMRERVEIPESINITGRQMASIDAESYMPFRTGYTRSTKVPEMDHFGRAYTTYHTGLTHDWSGLPTTCDVETHENLLKRLKEKITDNMADISRCETFHLEDGRSVVVSYGVTSRSALSAVTTLHNQGIRVGYLRLKTLWPFPFDIVSETAKNADRLVVAEMNMGQLFHSVREAAGGKCKVELLPKVGGAIHTPNEIMEGLR